MRELLRFEFFKLKKSAILYVLGGIMLFLILSNALSTYMVARALKLLDPDLIFDYSADLFTLSFFDSTIFVIICIIFSSTKALDDTRTKTIKNIIARGYTRTQIYFAKYIVSLISIVFYAVISIIFSFIVGLIFFGNPADYRVNQLFLGIVALIITAAALHTLFFGIAALFGNLAGAIVFDIFGFILIFTFLEILFIKVDGFSIMNYMPLDLSSSIKSAVLYEEIGKIFIDIAVALGYAGLGIGLGYLGSKGKQY